MDIFLYFGQYFSNYFADKTPRFGAPLQNTFLSSTANIGDNWAIYHVFLLNTAFFEAFPNLFILFCYARFVCGIFFLLDKICAEKGFVEAGRSRGAFEESINRKRFSAKIGFKRVDLAEINIYQLKVSIQR